MESQIEKYEPKNEMAVILQALESKIIRLCQPDEIKDALKKALNLAYFILNFNAPTQFEYNSIVAELLNQVTSSLPTMRIAEFELAVRNGCNKKYGDFMGVSVATMMKWFFDYSQDLKRQEVLKEKNKPVEVKQEPTPEEMRNEFLNRLYELFDIFKNQGNIRINEGAYYFDKLYKEKIIVFEEQLRHDLKERALKQVFERSQKIGKDTFEQQKIRERLNEITTKGHGDSEVITLAKYFGLITWFEFLVETEININDLINGN